MGAPDKGSAPCRWGVQPSTPRRMDCDNLNRICGKSPVHRDPSPVNVISVLRDIVRHFENLYLGTENSPAKLTATDGHRVQKVDQEYMLLKFQSASVTECCGFLDNGCDA